MGLWGKGWVCLLIWLGSQGIAWGDILYLKDGRKVEGIIQKETDSQVQLQVLWQGTMTVPKSAVVSVTRGSQKDRLRLLKKWRKDHLADQKRENERSAFEEAQRAKGLVKYQGQWLTKEEILLIQEKERKEREAKEKEQRQKETRQLEERLETLEEENRRLQRQINAQTELIFRQGRVVHHNDRALFKDEQGNLVRVQEELGQKFFVTSEGKRVNLEAHGGHLTFTDESGVHHDLQQVIH